MYNSKHSPTLYPYLYMQINRFFHWQTPTDNILKSRYMWKIKNCALYPKTQFRSSGIYKKDLETVGIHTTPAYSIQPTLRRSASIPLTLQL